jgi:hypothetical protein
MADDTASRPAETPFGGGHRRGSGGECLPLQGRVSFLATWHWELVIGINRRVSARGRVQHGINLKAGAAFAECWGREQGQELRLGDAVDLLRRFRRSVLFLFFNGNTCASIIRETAVAIFYDLLMALPESLESEKR